MRFGDQETYVVQVLNGVFEKTEMRHNNRFVYAERSSNSSSKGFFAHCGNAWAFLLLSQKDLENGSPKYPWGKACELDNLAE